MKISGIIFSLVVFLSACDDSNTTANLTIENDTVKKELVYTSYIQIYKISKSTSDSILSCEMWFNNDSIIKKTGEFYYRIPIESDYYSNYIAGQINGQAELETFDSLICEVGGKCAWNKYKIEYDSLKRPTYIKHYKAWWNEGLMEEERPEKPEYFLGYLIDFKYENQSKSQFTFTPEHEMIEEINREYDENERLMSVYWYCGDEHKYKIRYSYNDEKNRQHKNKHH